MYRSGSTYQFNLASEIIELKAVGARCDYGQYQHNPGSYLSKVTNSPLLYRTLKLHRIPAEGLRMANRKEAKCLSCYRDIRDVVASWQAKNRCLLSVSDGLAFARMAIQEFTEWEELGNDMCLIQKYETMTTNPLQAVQAIANFLNIRISKEAGMDICKKCSINSARQRIKNIKEEDIMRLNSMAWDRHTLIHLDHLNAGTVGRFTEELNPDLTRILENEFYEWIINHGYSLSANL